jgi:hypothetical protein
MKPVTRFQSQLLPRRSYKPGRVIRIRPVKVRFVSARCDSESNQRLQSSIKPTKPRAALPRCAARADFRPVAQ